MDFSTKKYIFSENEIIHEGTVEQMVECDITLADYYPDIIKVLKCRVQPQIISATITGDRVTIEGKAQIRLIYAGGDNVIRCYEHSYPFSKFFEDASISENANATVNTRVEYVNCRAISPRKADIRASVVLSFSIAKNRKEEFLCDATGSGIELRKETHTASEFICCAEKNFSVGEVVEIPANMPSLIQKIREDAVIIPGEIKIINSKLLFKAEIIVTVLYCDEENNLNLYKKTIPITQVIELDSVDDGSDVRLMLDITCIDIQPKSDANSENRLFDINARVRAIAKITKDKVTDVLKDAYSTAYDIEICRKPIKIKKNLSLIDDTSLAKVNQEFSTSGISKIIDVWHTNPKSKVSFNKNTITVNNTLTLCLLYLDRDSSSAYAEREINFEYIKSVDNTENISFNPDLKIIDMIAVVLNDNKVEIKIEYMVSGTVYASEIVNAVTDIVLKDEKKKSDLSAMTIYFPDADEKVWDIAKKYNSTVERIIEDNSLTDDVIKKRCMLMITSV